MQMINSHGWESNPGLLERESGSKPTEPLMSSSMVQLVCCLTHVLRGPGSIPSHGSLSFASISMGYYMIYFNIYGIFILKIISKYKPVYSQ